MSQNSAAHYFLEGLCELGIEYLFCNLGTDHAPIIEELARWRQDGRPAPRVVLCGHENLAMHMAMGYAMATGRGQAVLVHVDVGTANAANGMHNLFRTRVPVLLMAGKAPFTQRGELPGSRDTVVNFLQEPFDMAALVRPYSKWIYDLPSGIVVKEALSRAHAVMHSDPPGPVFLTAAREVLMAEHQAEAVRSYPPSLYGGLDSAGVDDDVIDRLAETVLAARAPVLISAYAGRDPRAVAMIDELARFCGMRVYESNPSYLNIPRDSPCFAGFLAGGELGEVDFGLLVDVDVPWVPKYAKVSPATRWAILDADALKKDMPLWGFPADLRVQARAFPVLQRLLTRLRERASPDWLAAAETRLAELSKRRTAMADAARSAAANRGKHGQITAAWVAACLQAEMEADDILVHETITNVLPVMAQITRTKPLTVLANGGSGLGFGGAALGAKLAHPDRLVVHLTGDGSFIFSNPSAMMIAERQYGLPVLTVVLDNGGWGAVKGATQRAYPQGTADATGQFQAVLGHDLRHDKLAEVVNGHGECVEHPDEVPAALARGLAAVRRGDPAVVVIRVERIDA